MNTVTLLAADGGVSQLDLREPLPAAPDRRIRSRIAFAAPHVVPVVSGDNTPGAPAEIDWDTTLAFRHHLWACGLGVADAMDTAQRNMGLDPAATRELIARSAAEAKSVGGKLLVGVGTDHVEDESVPLPEIIDAYLLQLHHAEDHGADAVLMASRHLARAATSAADYEHVLGEVLKRAAAPVVLHWLGPAFDPNLDGYFGSPDLDAAADTVVRIITEHRDKVTGIKLSLLDADRERRLRARLPDGVRMFTGDDFNYAELIEGDGTRHSDALLGAFSAFAPVAAAALDALGSPSPARYRTLMEPTVPLSRHLFSKPTYHYKTGIAFLSWLNGHQRSFSMLNGMHAARSLPHLSATVALADAAGALERPDLAAARWNALLALHGV
ncbi:DUF993 family protein [Amycolatopsis sp. NPDC049253]|uniref:dihydrodipicolinate synthase family protein n=1 Tax=Amycolatopsis sp. NPDC049253 TaxID=3155274 RepID=UPI0034418B72